ncbi:cupin domain-containing protein [Paeniglutamicibacter sp. NPDC012692]|uniref:cupin domain-containing protein n=1 Tax=Paeniglutamicibacter sp. NPDC012692 TaxID=3364388 RepID=UPI00368FFDC5
MKAEHEFFDTSALEWIPDPDFAGVSQKILSHDDSGASTQLSKWDAGLDTSHSGVISHDFAEEVFLLSGELTDLTLNETFLAGAYTSRQPNMPHGPYVTRTGCVMLVIATPV